MERKRYFSSRIACFAIIVAGSFLSAQETVIPHITRDDGGFDTMVFIENPTASTLNYAMQGFDMQGQPLGTVSGVINATNILSWTKADLFGPSSGLAHLTLTPPSEGLVMTVSYQATNQITSPAHMGALQKQAKTWQFFPGNWDVVFDSIAVVNMGSQAADIFLSHKDFQGNVLDRRLIQGSVPSKGKVLFVVGDSMTRPFMSVPNSFFEVEAAQPLAMMAIRGSSNAQFLWANTARPFDPPAQTTPSQGIGPVPTSLGSQYTSNFDRYTKVTAPNGRAIHIVAQTNITDEQIIRCRSILEHYLRNYPGSTYGHDKSAVANKMADNNAVLLLLNGSDDGQNPVRAPGQALYQNEIQVEGHTWYVNQDYTHRDAAFEEILHLVHDFGIGVDGPNSSPGALPAYQAEIRAAQQHALTNNLWGFGDAQWITELTAENSLSQEYLAAVIDSYYGLWGAWTESTTYGMGGIYVAKTREEIVGEDPMGQQLLDNKFFHPYLTYNARIDAGFTGTFWLKFNTSIGYTHHSRYLKDITLLGNNNVNVQINEWDNDITGNAGTNTTIFSGSRDEYTINTSSGITIVTDTIANRDGRNTLRNIEKLQFSDQTIDL